MPNFEPALIVIAVFVVITLLLWGYSLRRINRPPNTVENDRKSQIVREAVGEFPAFDSFPTPKALSTREQLIYVTLFSIGAVLIYLALYVLLGVGIRSIWPALTVAQELFAENASSLLIPLIIGWFVLPLLTRWWILRPTERRFTVQEIVSLTILGTIKWIVIFSASIAMLITLEIAYGWLTAFIVFLANYFLFVALWRLLNKPLWAFPQYWAHSAIAQGNYDEALQRTQHLEAKYFQNAGFLYYRGTVLLFAGKFAEAEKFLRQSLQEALMLNRLQGEVLTNLGYAVLHHGRYDEAMRIFEAVIKLNPKSGHAYSGLAQIYLFQQIEPQKALDYLVHFMKVTPKRQVKDKSTWGAIRGDEAWALAMLGRIKDAREAIGLAFEMTDKSFKPGVASLRFKEGKVFQINGDRTHAEKSFNRAVQLDPVGMYGQLARNALTELQSYGNGASL